MPVGVNYETRRCVKALRLETGLADGDPASSYPIFVNLNNIVFARYIFEAPVRVELHMSDGSTLVVRLGFSYPVPGLSNYHSMLVPNENQFQLPDNDITDSSPGIGGGTTIDYESKRCLVTQEIPEDRIKPNVPGTRILTTAINMNHIMWTEEKQSPLLNSGNAYTEVHLSTGATLRTLRTVASNGNNGFHSFNIWNENASEVKDTDPEDSAP